MKNMRLLAAATWLPLLVACSIDSYDKGEGEYSLMTADLVEAYVGSDRSVRSVETDNGEQLLLASPLQAQWITTADTTYRSLLYYKKLDEGSPIEVVSLGRVGVLMPRDSVKGGLKTDPLHVESVWLSKNRKYLNLRLRLMTGATDDENAVHSVGLLNDTVLATPSHACLQLYHDQGGQPSYYSAVTYASIPLAVINADSLTITINTYEGSIARTFALH